MIRRCCQRVSSSAVRITTVAVPLVFGGRITAAESSSTPPAGPATELLVQANLRLAQRFLDKQEYEQAIRRCRTALKAKPGNPDSVIALASAYRKSGQTEPAIDHLLPLATQQGNPWAMAELGAVHYQLNQFAESKKLLLKAASSLPENHEIQLLLGSSHLAQAELTSAMSCLRKAAIGLPEKAEPFIQTTRQQFDESKKVFLQAMQAHQQFQQGNPTDPWLLYRKTIKLNSEFAPALNNLAWHLATSRDDTQLDPQEALRLAQSAVNLSGGKDPAFLETLAAAQAASGDFKSAIETTTSILGNPKAPNASKHLELYRKKIPLRE